MTLNDSQMLPLGSSVVVPVKTCASFDDSFMSAQTARPTATSATTSAKTEMMKPLEVPVGSDMRPIVTARQSLPANFALASLHQSRTRFPARSLTCVMSTSMSAKDHPNNAPGVPMVYPPAFERVQIKYMNPLVKRVARFMPGMAKVRHRGRKSGRTYETVVTPFRKDKTLAIALVHGKTDWVKNVLAANEADVVYGNQTVHIVNPRIVPAGGDA